MNKTVLNTLLILIGLVALYILGTQLINKKEVPSLQDFLASTTDMSQLNASSTPDSLQSISTTTPVTSLMNLPTVTVYTPKGSLKVFLATTSQTQEQGLSDIPSLPKSVGMLFVFASPGQYSFWMKDMLFPLDMVWIDGNKIVRDISTDALPSSYPATFTPSSPILYVLEMNANTARTFGLIKGASVKFTLP